jgi:hypothetical protein
MNQIRTCIVFFVMTCSLSLSAQVNRFDIVITEIMADPSPQVGLPNAEYIEVRNRSSAAINLAGLKLSDASSTATINVSYLLQPDSFLIICANSNVVNLSAFGKTIGVSSFPSLDNAGDQLVLTYAGKTIHAVAYTMEWYDNAVKQDGGWSLEMIDSGNPCTGAGNWKPSDHLLGGTPGKRNSVEAINTDTQPPQLVRTYSLDSLSLVAVFNEPLDSNSAVTIANFVFDNGMMVAGLKPVAPVFDKVEIRLSSPLVHSKVYSLSVENVKDCRGNLIGNFNHAKAGWFETAGTNDIIVNEILFNPKANAFDYVELLNRSEKILDASFIYIANRNTTGAVSSIKKLNEMPFAIYPGDHVVVTENRPSIQQAYLVKHPEHLLTISALPSLPDDKGTVVVLGNQGTIIDEVSYDEKWHFPLVTNAEGVSLERIDPGDLSQKADNWHSAASTSGYGTPTYQNSQLRPQEQVNATLQILPRVFSPDNDGYDDIATVFYTLNETGYVANIRIFDASGRPVRYFVKNELLGLKGSWNWNGLDEKNQRLPVGTYIIHTEIFNLQGKRKQFRNTVILARKLN